MKLFTFLSVVSLTLLSVVGLAQTTTNHAAFQAVKTKAATTPTETLAATAPSVFTGIQFNWGYTPSAQVPACPTTGTPTTCYSGFVLTDTTTNTVLANSTVLGSTALTYQWTPAGGLYFGTHTFTLVATGFDNTGAAIVSSAASITITNSLTSLAPPTGFTGTAN